MTQRKQKTVNTKANGVCSELIITIEKLPTHKLTAYKPQGDYAPYKNCQRSNNLAAMGMIEEVYRAPLCPMEPANKKLLIDELKSLNII